MAEPARRYDYESPRPPQDPFNPIPPAAPAVPPEPTDFDRPNVEIEDRSGLTVGNSVLIAAVIVILAAVAFYIFGPSATETTPPAPDVPAATAPADNGAATGTPPASGTAPPSGTTTAPAPADQAP